MTETAISDDPVFVRLRADEAWTLLQLTTLLYYLHETNPDNLLVRDKTEPNAPVSIAAVGMALATLPVVVERGILIREFAARDTLKRLRFLLQCPQGPEPDSSGYKGFFYHFLDIETGRRVWQCELSTIDSAFLFAGVLTVASYFDRDTAHEVEIRSLSYRQKLWMSKKGDVPFLGKLSSQPQSPGGNRGKGTPPMLKVITTQAEAPAGEAPTISATLDDLARDGARRMIAAALQLEAAEYVARFREARDEGGRAPGCPQRHGAPTPRDHGVGPVTLAAPRVNDRRVVAGVRQKFTSMILPPYVRRSPRVESVLPLLYLHGLSSGDFREALPALLGPEAAGLSSSAILRLTKSWTAEYEAFRRRDLADRDYIYLWADGVHFTIRLEAERLCTLVVIGVRPDGTKEVVALEDGYRESAESWRTLLRDLKRRGLRAPVLAVGDGALGFWAAVRDVWPETAEQRCWVHRIANVLDKLPRSLQPRAKQALHEIMYAETRAAAEREIARFTVAYQAKYPKAAASLTVDQDRLLAYFAYPAEHWKHLRTTNPIESTFATVRLREGVTKGAGSRTAGLVMAFKLLQVAEGHWRRIDAAELVPLVRAGVCFEDGVQSEPQKKRKKAAA
jgi:putative transposase